MEKLKNLSRSKRAFYNSLFELMKEKNFEEISVQNIIDKAQYSRSSFYSNFTDKYNMLEILMHDEAKSYIYHCTITLSKEISSSEKKDLYYKIGCSAFTYVYDRKDFYSLLIKNKFKDYDRDRFFEIVNHYYLENLVYPIAEKDPEMDLKLYSIGMTSLFGSFITFWVKNNFSYSYEYMASQLLHFLYNITGSDFMGIKQ